MESFLNVKILSYSFPAIFPSKVMCMYFLVTFSFWFALSLLHPKHYTKHTYKEAEESMMYRVFIFVNLSQRINKKKCKF